MIIHSIYLVTNFKCMSVCVCIVYLKKNPGYYIKCFNQQFVSKQTEKTRQNEVKRKEKKEGDIKRGKHKVRFLGLTYPVMDNICVGRCGLIRDHLCTCQNLKKRI